MTTAARRAASLSPRRSPKPAPKRCGRSDATSQRLGMRIERIAPGERALSMAVTDSW